MNHNDRGRPKAAPQTPAKKSDTTVAAPSLTDAQAPIHEPSAWLRGRVTERAHRARSLGFDLRMPSPVVIMPLGSSGASGTRADRECDRCETFVPEGQALYGSRLHALPGLLLVGAFCTACAALEVGQVLA